MSQQVTTFGIPANARDIVVFVHGFGVRWDSRGMFVDIQHALPKNWGYVFFDFYYIDQSDVFISPIDDQIARLESVLQKLKQLAPTATVHIIAHSKGCIITSLTQPTITGNVVFLAPPEIFGSKLEKYFARYPNAKLTTTEISIPRKDGTITHIPLNFFEQTKDVDAEEAMLNYSKKARLHILQTTQDEVLGETAYNRLRKSPDIEITAIDSDHNFTEHSREKLISYLKGVLNE